MSDRLCNCDATPPLLESAAEVRPAGGAMDRAIKSLAVATPAGCDFHWLPGEALRGRRLRRFNLRESPGSFSDLADRWLVETSGFANTRKSLA